MTGIYEKVVYVLGTNRNLSYELWVAKESFQSTCFC